MKFPFTPKWANRLLETFIPLSLIEEFRGDLEEVYYERLENMSPLKARLWYWADTFSLVYKFFSWKPSFLKNPTAMYSNYFKMAFRQIKKSKFYSALNILGLSMGFATFFLLFMYVNDEFSYDTFHEKADQTYRVACDLETPGTASGTEREAPPRDHIELVKLARKEQEDNVLIHSFEKVETAEEYKGGARETDSDDELDEHLEALEEVDLRTVIRGGEEAQSVYRTDLRLDCCLDGIVSRVGPPGHHQTAAGGQRKVADRVGPLAAQIAAVGQPVAAALAVQPGYEPVAEVVLAALLILEGVDHRKVTGEGLAAHEDRAAAVHCDGAANICAAAAIGRAAAQISAEEQIIARRRQLDDISVRAARPVVEAAAGRLHRADGWPGVGTHLAGDVDVVLRIQGDGIAGRLLSRDHASVEQLVGAAVHLAEEAADQRTGQVYIAVAVQRDGAAVVHQVAAQIAAEGQRAIAAKLSHKGIIAAAELRLKRVAGREVS